MKKTKDQLIYLSPDNLLTHPRNLRRFYPENQVSEMADSIRAAGGVKHALLIVPNGKAGHYFVVDGNMRLAGAKMLGKDCPRLKCEIVEESQAEQLLSMMITGKFRYDTDPVSDALHFQRLIDEEGLSVPQIWKATGIHSTVIYKRLELLKLDPEIQDLIGNRKLPADEHAVKAFLSISNSRARIKLAQRLARDGANIKTIVKSCERLNTQIQEVAATNIHKSSNESTAGTMALKEGISPVMRVKFSEIRKSAKAVCDKCDIKSSALKFIPEPAWSLIAHVADAQCEKCNIKDIKNACEQCPAVEIIRKLIQLTEEKQSFR